jgi:hypothetical protein
MIIALPSKSGLVVCLFFLYAATCPGFRPLSETLPHLPFLIITGFVLTISLACGQQARLAGPYSGRDTLISPLGAHLAVGSVERKPNGYRDGPH